MVSAVLDDSHIRTCDSAPSSLSPQSLLLHLFPRLYIQSISEYVSRGYTGFLATSIIPIPTYFERPQALLRTRK